MPLFRIIETVVYSVEADSAEEAREIFEQAEDINEFFAGVENRTVQQVQE